MTGEINKRMDIMVTKFVGLHHRHLERTSTILNHINKQDSIISTMQVVITDLETRIIALEQK